MTTPSLANAFSVSEINQFIADLLSTHLPTQLLVIGEISNLSVAPSGHSYFSLKDSRSTISCALFRGSRFKIDPQILKTLKNGDKVSVSAQLSVYPPRGHYQLIVNDLVPAGFGDLARAFNQLKAKLDSLGLTAESQKRPIPTFSRTLGVVTSPTGAAIRDVLSTLKRRAPFITVNIYPALVQGEKAPAAIIKALACANQDNNEVILLVRGGGSLEDLQAFNDESVAMAVANSPIAIITGVGHETDYTIVDFVSDKRAPTPTAAAEYASPDQNALKTSLQRLQQRLQNLTYQLNNRHRQQVNHYQKRLSLQHPKSQLQQRGQCLDELNSRLNQWLKKQLIEHRRQIQHHQSRLYLLSPKYQLQQLQRELVLKQQRLDKAMPSNFAAKQIKLQQGQNRLLCYFKIVKEHQRQLKDLEARLLLLSPLGILSRGYSLTFDKEGKLVRQLETLLVGDELTVQLADGKVQAKVTGLSKH